SPDFVHARPNRFREDGLPPPPRPPLRGHHPVGVREGSAERLLANDVLARLERPERLLGVKVGWRAEVDDVEVSTAAQIVEVADDVADPILLRHLARLRHVDVAERYDLEKAGQGAIGLDVLCADAAPDHPNPEGLTHLSRGAGSGLERARRSVNPASLPWPAPPAPAGRPGSSAPGASRSPSGPRCRP